MSKTQPEADPSQSASDFESSSTVPEENSQPSHEGGGYPTDAYPSHYDDSWPQGQKLRARARSRPHDIHVHLQANVTVAVPEPGSTYSDDFESSGTAPEENTQPSHEGGGYTGELGLPPGALGSGD